MHLMPESISSYGPLIDSLIWTIAIIVTVAFFLAEGALLYLAIRYRKREGKAARYIAGKGWKQLRWVFIPVVVVFCADMYIDARTSGPWELIKEATPPADLHVRITGQQFSWIFSYPAGRKLTSQEAQSVGEFHVPLGKTVAFDLESKDVLHSFWVPSLRLKQDAVPGRTIHGWFKATKTGTYDIACAEICGAGHTAMRAALVVQPQEEFDRWLDGLGDQGARARVILTSAGSLGATHQLVQTKGCLGCHSTDGRRIVGPSWLGLYGRTEHVVTGGAERDVLVDESYLRRSILEPMADIVKGYPPAMPPQRANLTDAQVSQIIDYIKSLKAKEN